MSFFSAVILNPYIDDQKINVFEILPSEIKKFKSEFDPTYVEKLDPGETESLIYLFSHQEKCLISSADKIVYRILGNFNKVDLGISLEEILQKIGLTRKLEFPFSKKYREKWSLRGQQERIQGQGIQKGLP